MRETHIARCCRANALSATDVSQLRAATSDIGAYTLRGEKVARHGNSVVVSRQSMQFKQGVLR